MKYKLIDEQDPRLRQRCEPHNITKETEQLVYDMIVTMEEHDGIGLAAPQVGVMERIFVIGHKDTGYVVCINPTWKAIDDAERESFLEGCLSFPLLEMNVLRYNKVQCTFTNLKGETSTKQFTGVWAQAIQHEHDHLEGITFDTRVPENILSTAKALRKEKLKNIKDSDA